jgi:hypothetical protein
MNILKVPAKYIPAGIEVWKMFYADGNTCLAAFDPETREPYGKLSVNIPNEYLDIGGDYCWIKDWSENEGVLHALLMSGLVEKLPITYPCGHAEAQLVRILFEQEFRVL